MAQSHCFMVFMHCIQIEKILFLNTFCDFFLIETLNFYNLHKMKENTIENETPYKNETWAIFSVLNPLPLNLKVLLMSRFLTLLYEVLVAILCFFLRRK